MLSFIYSLMRDFEQMFGERPNLLYINRCHFGYLRREFADPDDIAAMMSILGVTIMITESAANPHLARLNHTTRPRAVA
jgi:hypothetical protein